MSTNKMARCPLCTRETATFTHDGQRIYVWHLNETRARSSILADPDPCEASGWLVEDDDLLVVPRRKKKTSGVAQPRREWHCSTGAGCCRSNPCGDACRTVPDAPPVRPKENT